MGSKASRLRFHHSLIRLRLTLIFWSCPIWQLMWETITVFIGNCCCWTLMH